MDLLEFLRKWKISQTTFSTSVLMNESSFKKKASNVYPFYSFTDAEVKQIKVLLAEMIEDIEAITVSV